MLEQLYIIYKIK